MDYVGIDLHKTSSQVCILTEDGELIERRMKYQQGSCDKLFADKSQARILVDASTKGEWCACYLESLGHEVLIADPNFTPMHATRDRRIKTDKRDVRYAKHTDLAQPRGLRDRPQRVQSTGARARRSAWPEPAFDEWLELNPDA